MIKVVTDSTSDITQELAAKHDVAVVPLTVRFGDEEFRDGVDLLSSEFWKRLTTSSELPTTSQPPPGAFAEAFSQAKDAGYQGVLCITISSKLSGTFQSASLAAREFGDGFPIEVIDSGAVTTGLATTVLDTADSAKTLSLPELKEKAIRTAARVRTFATLQTMEYLVKGGRIGKAKGLVGGMLNIQPIIKIRDGEVHEESKARTRKRALERLSLLIHPNAKAVSICSGQAQDVSELEALIRKRLPNCQISVLDIGPVIGTYGGPGVVGVTFIDPE